MTTKEKLYKFGGGALSGGAVALLAFLGTQCQVDDWNKFGYAAFLAFISGAFHVIKNLKTTN